MNVNDYLIDPRGMDWKVLLKSWVPPLPDDFAVWLVNRLGEVIVVLPDESIHWLELGSGTLHRLASNREHFAQLLDSGNNADKWLRLSLIDACCRSGMILAMGECYGFKIPPALQGKYEVSNLKPSPLDRHYSLLAHLVKQEEIYWTAG